MDKDGQQLGTLETSGKDLDMQAAYATIGRGAGERRLGGTRWAEFKHDVDTILAGAAGGSIRVVQHDGYGEWEGATEDSHIVGYIYDSNVYEPWLRERLAQLAEQYEQDAIAYIVGESVLVGAGA